MNIIYTPHRDPETERRTRKWLGTKLANAGIAKDFMVWYTVAQLDAMPVMTLAKVQALALGGDATQWCMERFINFESFDDPTFHRRMHPNKPYPLVVRLKTLSKIDKEEHEKTTDILPP